MSSVYLVYIARQFFFGVAYLLPFAIMLAKLPFWAQIKNLTSRSNIIVSDLKRYHGGLLEYANLEK